MTGVRAALAACMLLPGTLPLLAQSRVVAEIPIELVGSKTVVPVTVGGSTLRLILDSGMPYDGILLFDARKVDRSRLEHLVPARIGGAGQGGATGALVDTAASFSIGPLKFERQPVTILTSDIYAGFPTDGVVGYSLLGHYAVRIDYDERRMLLYEPGTFSPGAGWESIDIYFKANSIPWTDIRVVTAGEAPAPIATYIDFASGEALELLERETNAFTTPTPTRPRLVGRGLSGDIYGKEGRVSQLLVGSFALHDVPVILVPAATRSRQAGADAIIGSGALRRFNLIFDYAHRKIHLRPNRSFAEPYP